MQDWFDGAIRVSYTVEGDRKPFGHDRAFLRPTGTGEFVIMAEKAGRDGDAFHDRMKPGRKGTIHVAEPRPAEYRTGFLKSAYLAACLRLSGVPDIPSAREIRAELHAARATRRRRDVTLGERARALGIYRTGDGAGGPPLALVRSEVEGGERFLLSLAGSMLVDWPFPEISPLARMR
jgi:hypothetical protein